MFSLTAVNTDGVIILISSKEPECKRENFGVNNLWPLS